MEEAEVRESKTNATRWALTPAACAVALTAALPLVGGPAQAQDPPIYEIPTPTATPTAIPFTSTGPSTPPSLPETGLRLMHPFPKIRAAGYFTARRTTITRFTVRGPVGVKVSSTCVRSKCSQRRTLKTRKAVHLRKLERSFNAGAEIRLRVTAPDVIGKYVQIRLRRGKQPLRRDACLRPGRTRPIRCGTGG